MQQNAGAAEKNRLSGQQNTHTLYIFNGSGGSAIP